MNKVIPARFQDLSKKLVATARGDRAPEMYWELKNKKLASGDDISAIVVGLRVSVNLIGPTIFYSRNVRIIFMHL